MAISVKKVQVWASTSGDRTGLLADALQPLADAGGDPLIVRAYCLPGEAGGAVVDVFPVTGRKAQAAARAAGLSPVDAVHIFVEGDDRPGMAAAVARAVAGVGVSMAFFLLQRVGRRFSALLGFKNDTDAAIAGRALKELSTARPASRAASRVRAARKK